MGLTDLLKEFSLVNDFQRNIYLKDAHDSLYINLVSAGYDYCRRKNYFHHSLRRSDYGQVLIQHTISGHGELMFEGEKFITQPGQTMLLRFPQNSSYGLGAHKHWEFFWLLLSGSEILRLWDRMIYNYGPLHHFDDETVQNLANFCYQTLTKQVTTAGQSSAVAYQATMVIFDATNEQARKIDIDHFPLAYVANYIDSHLSCDLSVATLAKLASYSRYHFSRLFKQHMNSSPAAYVLEKRLQHATDLLVNTEKTIKAIAFDSGFNTANYFTKCFMLREKVSPSVYRQQKQK